MSEEDSGLESTDRSPCECISPFTPSVNLANITALSLPTFSALASGPTVPDLTFQP